MATHLNNMRWFLAQIKPNSAKIAERHLLRQGFEVFLPLTEETRQRNGKFSTTVRPLFPGYIFVALDTAKGEWRAVNSTQGITQLVRFGAMPAPVPTELVVALQARCDEQGKLAPPAALAAGDVVTLTKGPFTSFIAEVERITPDRRVWVLMDIMGAATRVSVDPADLNIA